MFSDRKSGWDFRLDVGNHKNSLIGIDVLDQGGDYGEAPFDGGSCPQGVL